MAPRELKVEVNFPKEFNMKNEGRVSFPLQTSDFDLSWLEFFRKNNELLYKKLLSKRDVYTIMDRRTPVSRKIWKLTEKVRGVIDSFAKNMSCYKTEIGKLPPNACCPQQGSSSQINRGTNSKKVSLQSRTVNSPPIQNGNRTANGVVPSSSPLKRKNTDNGGSQPPKSTKITNITGELRIGSTPGNQHHPGRGRILTKAQLLGQGVRGINILPIPVEDDTASMAETVNSQDSQVEDLMAQGIVIKDIKSGILEKFRTIDNNSLLAMRHELITLNKQPGKFMRAARYFPLTANLLQSIFYLNCEK